MASNYGLNFGFRRSDESLSVREGRFLVPTSGTFRQGSLVELDPAAAGYLKASATDMPIASMGGSRGLLVQEEAHIQSVYNAVDTPIGLDTFATRYGVAVNGRRAIIWSGNGVKFWLRNTASSTRADGRVVAAVNMVTFTGIALGDYIKWNGTLYVKGTGATDSVARVTALDATNSYLEAVLLG